MFTVMYGRRLFSGVFAITERTDMCLYEVPLSMTVLPIFICVLLRAGFFKAREKC